MLESADAHGAIIFQPEIAALIECVWMEREAIEGEPSKLT